MWESLTACYIVNYTVRSPLSSASECVVGLIMPYVVDTEYPIMHCGK